MQQAVIQFTRQMKMAIPQVLNIIMKIIYEKVEFMTKGSVEIETIH
jgi:hypothetical protein